MIRGDEIEIGGRELALGVFLHVFTQCAQCSGPELRQFGDFGLAENAAGEGPRSAQNRTVCGIGRDGVDVEHRRGGQFAAVRFVEGYFRDRQPRHFAVLGIRAGKSSEVVERDLRRGQLTKFLVSIEVLQDAEPDSVVGQAEQRFLDEFHGGGGG